MRLLTCSNLLFDFPAPESSTDVTALLSFSLLTSALNALVVITIWKDPFKTDLRGIPDYLILNLAVSDLLVGIPGELLFALLYWYPLKSVTQAADMSLSLGFWSSTLTVLGLAVERLIVISYPLKSADYLTYRNLTLGILCIWLLAGLITILPSVLDWDSILRDRIITTDVFGLLVFTLIVACYSRIFFLVRKGVRPDLTTEARYEERQCLTENAREREKIKRRERSVMRCGAILIGLLTVCWTPYRVLGDIDLYCGESCVVPGALKSIANVLALLHSLVNPIAYSLCTRKFRRALWKIICKCNCASPS